MIMKYLTQDILWAPGCCKGQIAGTSRGNRFTVDYTDDDNKIEKFLWLST